MKTHRMALWTLAAALALAACAPTFAQTGEGYDPMAQIMHQFAHPNLFLVVDTSGSMAWDSAGNSVGVDSTGLPYWRYEYANTAGCARNKYSYFKYTLVFANPSRMAILKNALGDAVTLYTAVKPATWPAYAGWTYRGLDGDGNPYWDKTIACTGTAQGAPFAAPTAGTASSFSWITEIRPPGNLVGNTSNLINWGLITFSANEASCSKAEVKAQVDRTDAGSVTSLLPYFQLTSVNASALGASGATPTRGALQFAKTALQYLATGGSYTDYSGTTWTVTGSDPKFFACQRTYGVILVTDGQSNNCNESDSTAAGYCWRQTSTCTSTNSSCCDAGNLGDVCPGDYTRYTAGRAEEIYNLSASGQEMHARTWVIGMSTSVNPCELNYTAYMGRTDASSPNGDAGFDTDADPYLPESTGDTSNYSLAHGNYAYFATNSDALVSAFSAIVAGVAAGDYTTSAPTSSGGVASGLYAFLSSAEFPDWKGHVYAFDVSKPYTDPDYQPWDAGEELSNQPSSQRRIWTWNAAGDMVEVVPTNLTQLQTIAAAASPGFTGSYFTANVLDFTRGNNGTLTNTARSWKLGPVINSTPAVIGTPESYKQNLVENHVPFEEQYHSRTALLWVGADDGMLHAFTVMGCTIDGVTYPPGAEVLALVPPNMLARQVLLYNGYHPTKAPTGQPTMPGNHIYGVANSPRFGDVWFPTPSPGQWKTLLFMTQGAGGDKIAAIDVTDPVGRAQASTGCPVDVVWQADGTTIPGLKATWSMAAFGSTTINTMKAVKGSGYDYASSTTTPYAYTFDPVTGIFISSGQSLSPASTSYVRNQAFADSVIFARMAKGYYPDNLVTQAIQADLHGRLWFMNSSAWTPFIGVDATAIARQPQPIYYSPSVSGFRMGTEWFDIYAFASGSFYEKDVDVSGPNVGSRGYFEPSLYVAVRTGADGAAVPSSTTLRIAINTITYEDSSGTTRTLGPRTQVVAPQLLLVPTTGSEKPLALFLVYDPDTMASCAGESFMVLLTINIASTGVPTASQVKAYSAGYGAGSGFAIVGNQVVVGKSGVGAGGKANLGGGGPPPPPIPIGTPEPVWWRELQ